MTGFEKAIRVKERYEDLWLSFPGIHGVCVAYKTIGGRNAGLPSIRLFTTRKAPGTLLPPALKIPPLVDGVPTDIVERPPIHPIPLAAAKARGAAEADTRRYRPVPGGVQINPARRGYGTLGAFVVPAYPGSAAEEVYILSNYHVISASGEAIYQPDSNGNGENLFAHAAYGDYYEDADAAVARLTRPEDALRGEIRDIGAISGSHRITADDIGKTVIKRGRTTLVTKGYVAEVEATIETINRVMRHQIVVFNETPYSDFSLAGDSGSLVVLDGSGGKAVGLLWGGTDATASSESTTIISPIHNTLERLGMALYV
jgi:hypothetical protein